MAAAMIAINAGSTSVKFGVYAATGAAGSPPLLCAGQIDAMQDGPHFVARNPAGKTLATHEWGDGHAIDHKTALHFVITWLEANIAGLKVVAAGHRVVLGGARFAASVRIAGDVLDYLEFPGRHGTVAPGLQRPRRPGARRGVPRPAAGRLLRQLVPSDDAGGRADLRPPEGRP